MATLVSPGVSTSVINQSFFVPATAPTVPLFFVATRANKLQPDGISPAAATQEYGVVRTVTSIQQMLELYGVPYFHKDVAGNEFHGDARNEYGLLALYQFLGAGNRAYVVRANIDLNDEPQTYLSLGTPALVPGSTEYNGIGDGALTGVSCPDATVKPQTFAVVFTTPTTFSVTGSDAGYVGTGVVGVAFNSTKVSFTVSAGATNFAAGDRFSFRVGYVATPGGSNVGTGSVTNLVPDTLATPETVTITFTTGTAFNVVGSLSGPAGTGTVNVPFDNNRLNFTIVNGVTPFAAGDTFTVVVSSITVSAPLGANDAARRLAIVTALQAAVNSNVEVRSPLYEFNLIACPGYWELADEMLSLSVAVKEEAFVVADTPFSQTPEQTAQWALTSGRATSTNVAYYYPWALQSNLDGRDVLGAPSGTALRTYAISDQQSYVWFAPAGVSRGVVSGVAKVGFVTGTPGTATTFVEANLNDGQRDSLYEYDKNINPITFFPGRGLLVWGQKTAAPVASALDRVNVVRLVMYLRRGLRKLGFAFVFEPNDQITRDNLKAAADGFLNDVLTKRGLYDYATRCDASNNTPQRIAANELWLDVAIDPTKAAEFIYIPITVVNTGAEL